MSFQELPFLEIFKDASSGNIKTPQKEFLEEGEIPVVDQGQRLVAGFVNDRSRICNAKPPVIVFGDHTRAIKYVDFEFAMGADGTKVLVPKVESDTKYLYYVLNAIEIPAAGYSRHYKFLKKTKIPLPPLAEQKRIAGILDAADALRAKRRESLAQLDTLLQSTFLDMFGDPITNPMGWDVKPLGELCAELYRYPTFYGTDYLDSGTPVVRIGNITAAGLLDDDLDAYVKVAPAFADQFPRTKLELNDVVMAVRGDGSTASRIGLLTHSELIGANMSPNLLRFKPSPHLLTSAYFFALLTSSQGQALLAKNVRRTAKRTITATGIRAIGIPLPPLDLQRRFAAIVESVEQQKTRQRAHLDELDTLFASLRSRAFRGEL